MPRIKYKVFFKRILYNMKELKKSSYYYYGKRKLIFPLLQHAAYVTAMVLCIKKQLFAA